MTWWAILILVFGLLLAAFATGIPIFASFMGLNIIAVLLIMGPAGLALFVNSMIDTVTSEALVAVPLFVLLGELLFRSGGVDVLYKALNRLIGSIPGRLYVVATALAALLGAICGASSASVAMLGRFVYPTMIKRGCDRRLTIGTILGGATLDPIIPPSVLAVILATLANLSIGEFLIAGILPGILLACACASYAVIRTVINPELDAQSEGSDSGRNSWRASLAAAASILPLCLIIFLVLGLVMLGIAQPTEAAAVGIVGAVLLSFIWRTFSMKMLYSGCAGAAYTTATVLIIIASSKLFSQVLAYTGATGGLIQVVSNLDINRWLIYLAMMATIFVVCMFMDQLALMMIAVPVFSPIIIHLGFDPIWFWMIFLINITLGGITPPFGYTMFVFKSVVPDVTLTEIYRSAWPVVAVAVVAMAVMTVFPEIVTLLPSYMRASR